MMLCGLQVVLKVLFGRLLGLKSSQRGFEYWQLLVRLEALEAFGGFHLVASIMPAAVQRSAMLAFRHRFTLRQTRRTVPITFSIELVQASERRSFAGSFRRLTVSISSRPSRMLAATPGASWSSRRARLRNRRSALSASSSSQACRSALRAEACSGFGSRSITLRALW